MKRKRNTSVIVCLINNVIYLLSVRQSGFHPLLISKIKQTGGVQTYFTERSQISLPLNFKWRINKYHI